MKSISRFREDVDSATDYPIGFNDLIAFTIFAAVALVIMFRINSTITIAVFVPLGFVVFVVNAVRRRTEAYRRANREATGRVTGFLGEVMGAVQAVQVANAEEQVIGHFRELSDIRLKAAVRDSVFDQVREAIFANTINLGTGAILLLAGQAMRGGAFTVGDFALFTFYLGWLSEFTTLAGRLLAQYHQVGVAIGRMTTLLAGAPTETLVRPGPVYLSGPFPEIALPSRAPTDRLAVLETSGLSYRYPDTERGIADISFRLERESFTVVTGRIGSGKTTLLQVLLGLLPRDAGEIRWNGQDVADPAAFFVPPRAAFTTSGTAAFQRVAPGQPPARSARNRRSIYRPRYTPRCSSPISSRWAAAWKRWSGQKEFGCPAVRSSESRRRGCLFARPSYSSSTTSRARSTSKRKRSSGGASFPVRARPAWSFPTAAPPFAAPTTSSS